MRRLIEVPPTHCTKQGGSETAATDRGGRIEALPNQAASTAEVSSGEMEGEKGRGSEWHVRSERVRAEGSEA